MSLSKEEIATRYAAALFDYVQDEEKLDSTITDLRELRTAVLGSPKIISVFSDPILDRNEKKSILEKIEKGLSAEVQNFLNFLLDYGRFSNLVAIIDQFINLYNQEKGIQSGIVTTAVKLDELQLENLSKSVAKKYNFKTVLLENEIEPEIIGGVILQIGDRVIDGSVKSKLNRIHAQLVSKN